MTRVPVAGEAIMFDLVTGHVDRPFMDSKPGSKFISIVAHTALLSAVLLIPLLYATNQLPQVKTMAAFIVEAPPPPPPPPPPAAPKAPEAASHAQAQTAAPVNPDAAPIEAPAAVLPEPAVPAAVQGVEGGVEGGVVGGVVGGIVGGLLPPPPPPPPPAPRPAAPVRVGGQITTPALVKRVEPTYPAVAVAAKLTGTVILEVVVNEEGSVQDVTVLRSVGALDRAAIDAVKEWRYSPLVLNGIPTPFVVTVTLNFSLRAPKGSAPVPANVG
jgi:protein TonB